MQVTNICLLSGFSIPREKTEKGKGEGRGKGGGGGGRRDEKEGKEEGNYINMRRKRKWRKK